MPGEPQAGRDLQHERGDSERFKALFESQERGGRTFSHCHGQNASREDEMTARPHRCAEHVKEKNEAIHVDPTAL